MLQITGNTREILRCGHNCARGLDQGGRMDMGLICVSYQVSLNKGFRTVQTRLNGEPRDEYIRPFGGGYFFVLPGLAGQDFLGNRGSARSGGGGNGMTAAVRAACHCARSRLTCRRGRVRFKARNCSSTAPMDRRAVAFRSDQPRRP